MAHQRFCKVCRGWHDLDEPWPHNCLPEAPQRSDLPCPSVIGDTMSAVQSQLTGKLYDSKSQLRAEYRQHGAVEVGNDPARLRPKPKAKTDRKAVKDAVHKAEARFNRGERTSDRMKFK